MASFQSLNLQPNTLSAIEELGYSQPTPIQEKAIPLISSGADVVASAQTGTGKTAAFALPSMEAIANNQGIERLSNERKANSNSSPRLLVVTPTRELTDQIERVCNVIARHLGLRCASIVGGVDPIPQIELLGKKVDVLVGTPGRLIDLHEQGHLHLENVRILVLDEADRMLDMGFMPQVSRIVQACPQSRQTLLFTATIDKRMEKRIGAFTHNPLFVEVARRGETAKTVRQYKIDVDHRCKPALIASILKERGHKRVIVFARTKNRVDSCVSRLSEAGYKADALHAGRSQAQRRNALQYFENGKLDILVATDVLARGIDVKNVSYVVNYDVPVLAEDYVHRIGRTGRANKSGMAITFVTPETEADFKAIEELIGFSIPNMESLSFDSKESERAMAARATRKAARKDPELAAAAKEYEALLRKRERKRKAKQGTGKARQGLNSKAGTSSSSNGPQSKTRRPKPSKTGRRQHGPDRRKH